MTKQNWVGKKSAAIVGLVALILLQISSAAHQFDHTIVDSAETCELCVQLDRSGDAPPASLVTLDISPDAAAEIVAPLWVALVAPTVRQPIRGPPNA